MARHGDGWFRCTDGTKDKLKSSGEGSDLSRAETEATCTARGAGTHCEDAASRRGFIAAGGKQSRRGGRWQGRGGGRMARAACAGIGSSVSLSFSSVVFAFVLGLVKINHFEIFENVNVLDLNLLCDVDVSVLTWKRGEGRRGQVGPQSVSDFRIQLD